MGYSSKINTSKRVYSSAAFQPYPRNCWYIAAGRAELGRTLLSRELLGTKVVMYRTENGDPVALMDRCPHRGFPLSNSELIGDEIQCGYHGMMFNASGQCTHVPSQSGGVRAMRTPSYPLVEKWLWVWIWLGDPDLADPALIPECGYEDRPYHLDFVGCVPIAGNYQMGIDNLLDPTHASFLHKGLLDDADSKDMASASISVEQTGDKVFQDTVIPRFTPNANIAHAFALTEGVPVHRLGRNMFQAPCFVNASATFTSLEAPDEILSEFVASMPIVPAGPGRLHHFIATCATFKNTPDHRAYYLALIDQDKDAMEAIQAAADPQDIGWEMSVRSDETGVRARRMVMAMIDREDAAGAARS